MNHQTKVYCSSIIKDLIPKAKEYEKTVISIASKFGQDLAKVEKSAEELYSPSIRQDNRLMSYYDSQARKKKEEEQQAELKVLNDKRKAYVESKKETLVPAAREQIRAAQRQFQEEAARVAKSLKEKLEKDVTTPLNRAFLDFARVFNEFGVSLTDLDCDALLTFSEDNPLAYRIIQNIIDKTKSPYTFIGKDTKSYSDDIRIIEEMAGDNCFCVPLQVSHEMNVLFNGVPVHQKTAESFEEKVATNFNETFDTTKLSMCSGSFTYNMEKLNKISESWSEDVKIEYDYAKAMAYENAEKSTANKATKATLDAYMK